MRNDRLNNLLESLGLDEKVPPTAAQWGLLIDALRQYEIENRALRLSERRTANLLQAVPDQVFLVSADGRILDHRPGKEFATYVPREEFLGRKFSEVLPEAVAERLREAVDLALATQSVCITEYTLGNKEYEARLTSEDGETVIGLVRDITVRRNAEHELRRSEESLKRAKNEAEKANRAKSQFLSNMSHELKTPLNAILGFGRVLARESYGELSPQQRQFLEDILQSGEHMLDLVNNLLDLRQMEAGEDLLKVTTSHLHPLVEEAAAMVGSLAETRGQLLSIDLPADLPEILVDHRAVVRTLVNLLSNAIKYTQHGGHIEIRAVHQDDQLRIEVHDSGVGIAPADQKRIFGYFEQIRTEDGPMVTGSGIGLALSRELVERMGGTIGVRSQLGKGSCFHFTVPFAPVDLSGPTEERLDKTVPSPFKGSQ